MLSVIISKLSFLRTGSQSGPAYMASGNGCVCLIAGSLCCTASGVMSETVVFSLSYVIYFYDWAAKGTSQPVASLQYRKIWGAKKSDLIKVQITKDLKCDLSNNGRYFVLTAEFWRCSCSTSIAAFTWPLPILSASLLCLQSPYNRPRFPRHCVDQNQNVTHTAYLLYHESIYAKSNKAAKLNR